MISYDSYKNRIEKVAKIKRFVVKFKFLIIGVLALLLAGVSGLLATKGMFTAAMTLPAEITYGEHYAPIQEAQAFLSSVSYEYTLKNKEEWSEVQPTKVGTYLARAVTNKTVGKGYSDPVEFTIVKKQAELSIISNSMTYGDQPVCSLDGIEREKYGDRIVGVGSVYDLPKAGESMDIEVTVGKVLILDGQGNDSSDCYEYSPVKKTVTLNKRIINVQTLNITQTYSGKPVNLTVELSEATKQTLAIGGDSISDKTVTFTRGGNAVASPEEADYYSIDISDVSILHEGEDVTHLYDINYIGAPLTINQKPITITTGSSTKVYDGTPVKNETFSSDGLISGHRVEAVNSFKEFTDVGQNNNYNIFAILDGNGKDVTDNYLLTRQFGTITVNKRPVTIETEAYIGVYDGNAHTSPNFTTSQNGVNSGLVSGHNAQVSGNKTSVKNVADSKKDATAFKIFHGSVDVTTNYEITYNYGDLTVTKRPVIIETEGYTGVYDGNAHFSPEFTPEQSGVNRGLVSGHNAQISGYQTSVTNVADSKKDATKFIIKDGSGWYSNDVTDNYQITYNYGDLTVTKRNITVKLSDYTAVYGNSYAYSTLAGNYDNAVLCDLATDERLTVTNPQYEFGNVRYPEVRANAYAVTSSTAQIKKGTTDTTANYNIEFKGGSVKILLRPLTLTSNTNAWTYDGAEHTENGYTVTAGSLPEGQAIAVTPVAKVTNYTPTAVDNLLTYDILYNGASVKHNYDLQTANGTLTVNKRPISTNTSYVTKEYDGTPLVGGGIAKTNLVQRVNGSWVETDKPGLIGTDRFNVDETTYPSITNVSASPVDNRFTFTVPSDNYIIEKYNYGTLTITKRAITLTSNGHTWTYNDEEYEEKGFTITSAKKLAGNQTIEVANGIPVKDYTATPVDNVLTYYIKDGDNTIDKGNYAITEIWGKLSVLKRAVKITTDDYKDYYDGNAHTSPSFTAEESNGIRGLVSASHSAQVDGVKTSVTNVADSKKDATLFKIFRGGEDVTVNYSIEYVYGTLTVERLAVTIQLNSKNIVYGDEFTYGTGKNNYDVANSSSLVSGETLEVISVNYEFGSTICPAVRENPYAITSQNTKVTKSNGEDSTGNYKITVNAGTFTVTKRTLKVTTNTSEWIYDGEEHFDKGFEITQGSLPSRAGQPIQAITVTKYHTVKNYTPTAVENALTLDITYNGASVKSNYDFEQTNGTLTVTQRHLYVKTGSLTATYDGQKHSTTQYETAMVVFEGGVWVQNGKGLIGSDKLVIDNGTVPTVTDVKDSPVDNAFTFTAPSDNYVVEYGVCEYGTLTVYPAQIIVTLKSYSVTYGDKNYRYPTGKNNYDLSKSTALVAGETLTITKVSYEFGDNVTYPDARKDPYKITLVEYEISKADGSSSYDNYTVNPAYGWLTVNALSISIETPNLTFTYNGEYQFKACIPSLSADGTLPEGQSFVPDTSKTLTGVRDAGTYKNANVQYYKIVYEGNDVTSNYDVTENFGDITVEKKDVTVKVDDILSGNVKYGEKFTHTATCVGLVDGETMTPAVTYLQGGNEVEAKNAGTYTVKLNTTGCKFFYKGGAEQTVQNYNVTSPADSTLVIDQREITVTFKNIEREYGEVSASTIRWSKSYEDIDVDSFSALSGSLDNYISITGDGLAYGDYVRDFHLRNADRTSMRNAGTYDITCFAITIYNSDRLRSGLYVDNQERGGNYKFTIANTAKLTIKQKKIDVVLADVHVTYGESPALAKYPKGIGNYENASTLELAFGEKLEFTDLKVAGGGIRDDRLHAGSFGITSGTPNFFKSDGTPIENGADNYIIEYDIGTLTVHKKAITLTLNQAKNDGTVYGTQLSYTPHLVTDADFAYGQKLELHAKFYTDENCTQAVSGLPKNAGTYYYTIDKSSSIIFAEDGTTVVSNGVNNYDFTCKSSATILKKKLSLTIHDSKIDFGDELPYERYQPHGRYEYGEHVDILGTLEYNDNELLLRFAYYYYNGYETMIPPTVSGNVDYGYDPLPSDEKVLCVDVNMEVGMYYIGLYGFSVCDKNGYATYSEGNYEIEVTDGILTIDKRAITVNPDKLPDVVHGDPVSYPVNYIGNYADIGGRGLASGQSLAITQVEYYKDGEKIDGVPTAVGKYTVKPCAVAIYGLGQWGNSVQLNSNNFDITYGESEFAIKGESVKVIVHDKTFTYDGTPQGSADIDEAYFYDENGIIRYLTQEEIDSISVTPVKITNVWESLEENSATFSHATYVIDAEFGKLTMLPRSVDVTSQSKVFVYDGTAHTWNFTDDLSEIVDEYDVVWKSKAVVNVDDGEEENTFTIEFAAKDGLNGHTVSENYILNYIYGKISVTARTLCIVTGSAEKVYDGKALSTTDYDETFHINENNVREEGLLGADADKANGVLAADPSTVTELYDAGTKLNATRFTSKNNNYVVTTYYRGTLKVTKAKLHISLEDISVTYGEDANLYGIGVYDKTKTVGLVNSEALTVGIMYYKSDAPEIMYGKVRDAGVYKMTLNDELCFVDTRRYDENGVKINGYKNYEVTFGEEDEATLTIVQKTIYVEAISYLDEVYGEAFKGYPDKFDNFVNPENVLEYSEQLKLIVEFVDGDGNPVEITERTGVNTFTIKIVDMLIVKSDGSNGKLSNYVIETCNGVYKINPRQITYTRKAVTETYDGTWHEAREWDTVYAAIGSFRKPGLVNGDTLDVVEETITRLRNAGSVTITTEFTASDNYVVTAKTSAKLTVQKREITVLLNQVESKEYGGKLVYDSGIGNYDSITKGSLVTHDGGQEKLEIGVTFYSDEACTQRMIIAPVDVGTYYYKRNNSACKITNNADAELENGINNYNIITVYEKRSAKITPKKVTVILETPNKEFTYDGTTHEYFETYSDGYTLAANNSFAYGEKIEYLGVTYSIDNQDIPFDGMPRNAATYRVTLNRDTTIIGGLVSTVNYELICENGVDLVINKKDLKVVVRPTSRVYDKTVYNTDYIPFTQQGLVSDERIIGAYKLYFNGEEIEEIVNAGKYTAVFDRDAYTIAGGLTSNYNLISTEANETAIITINPRTITQLAVKDRQIEVSEAAAQANGEDFTSLSVYGTGIIAADKKELKPFYTYKKDGVPLASFPTSNGTYTVAISFTDASDEETSNKNLEILANYTLPATFGEGTLEITARLVTVKAYYEGPSLTYGDFTEVDANSDGWINFFRYEHWHTTAADEEGFVNGFADALVPVYEFYLNGNKVEKPVHAGKYELRVTFTTEIPKDDYFVACDPTEFEIIQKAVTFDMSAFNEETVYGNSNLFDKFSKESILEIAREHMQGFIRGDENDERYELNATFRRDAGIAVSTTVDDVGTYAVVALFSQNYDYKIDMVNSVWGTLTVRPYVIYVKANSLSDLYKGQTIKLTENDFTIIGGENGSATTLVPGDVMTITPSAALTPSSIIQPVTVAEYEIKNANGRPVNMNYQVYTAYDAEVMEEEGYTSADFLAILSYRTRTVYYKQAELKPNTFAYTGNNINLNCSLEDAVSDVTVADCDGLMPGHTIQARSIMPIKNPGVYANWVVIKIVDAKGNDVTKFYNAQVYNKEESTITVEAVKLSVKVEGLTDAALQNAWTAYTDDNVSDGSVLKIHDNYKEGWAVLNPDLYTVEGLWTGHECEIVVVKDESGFTFKLITYQKVGSSGVRSEKSLIYELESPSLAGLSVNVELAVMMML
ncbi:MAG: hypothetical protein K2K38_01625 [Clostridia bacterium]|nr:hypothetical protein [Clostridia bacterium]